MSDKIQDLGNYEGIRGDEIFILYSQQLGFTSGTYANTLRSGYKVFRTAAELESYDTKLVPDRTLATLERFSSDSNYAPGLVEYRANSTANLFTGFIFSGYNGGRWHRIHDNKIHSDWAGAKTGEAFNSILLRLPIYYLEENKDRVDTIEFGKGRYILTGFSRNGYGGFGDVSRKYGHLVIGGRLGDDGGIRINLKGNNTELFSVHDRLFTEDVSPFGESYTGAYNSIICFAREKVSRISCDDIHFRRNEINPSNSPGEPNFVECINSEFLDVSNLRYNLDNLVHPMEEYKFTNCKFTHGFRAITIRESVDIKSGVDKIIIDNCEFLYPNGGANTNVAAPFGLQMVFLPLDAKETYFTNSVYDGLVGGIARTGSPEGANAPVDGAIVAMGQKSYIRNNTFRHMSVEGIFSDWANNFIGLRATGTFTIPEFGQRATIPVRPFNVHWASGDKILMTQHQNHRRSFFTFLESGANFVNLERIKGFGVVPDDAPSTILTGFQLTGYYENLSSTESINLTHFDIWKDMEVVIENNLFDGSPVSGMEEVNYHNTFFPAIQCRSMSNVLISKNTFRNMSEACLSSTIYTNDPFYNKPLEFSDNIISFYDNTGNPLRVTKYVGLSLSQPLSIIKGNTFFVPWVTQELHAIESLNHQCQGSIISDNKFLCVSKNTGINIIAFRDDSLTDLEDGTNDYDVVFQNNIIRNFTYGYEGSFNGLEHQAVLQNNIFQNVDKKVKNQAGIVNVDSVKTIKNKFSQTGWHRIFQSSNHNMAGRCKITVDIKNKSSDSSANGFHATEFSFWNLNNNFNINMDYNVYNGPLSPFYDHIFVCNKSFGVPGEIWVKIREISKPFQIEIDSNLYGGAYEVIPAETFEGWNDTTDYSVKAIKAHSGNFWLAVSDPPAGAEPGSTSYWKQTGVFRTRGTAVRVSSSTLNAIGGQFFSGDPSNRHVYISPTTSSVPNKGNY